MRKGRHTLPKRAAGVAGCVLILVGLCPCPCSVGALLATDLSTSPPPALDMDGGGLDKRKSSSDPALARLGGSVPAPQHDRSRLAQTTAAAATGGGGPVVAVSITEASPVSTPTSAKTVTTL